MSRVADALSRAAGRPVATAEPFREDDHPWGGDLTAEADLDDGRVDAPAFRLSHPHVADTAAAPPPVPVRTPSTARSMDSPATQAVVIDDALRPHLVALVERVFAPVSGNPARSVAFSGLGSQSAFITAAAADLLATQTGASVCVVDAHFASPSLHEQFGVDNHAGLSEAVEGDVAFSDVLREVRPNLWLLSAGGPGRRPSFASDSIRLRIAQFIARFDYVLADIEPVSGVSDATGLAPLVDGVILVLDADATRRESARRAGQALRAIGATVLGAVLTNRRFPIPDALYQRL
jgi:Mrp family chromosome partitioning ATPase